MGNALAYINIASFTDGGLATDADPSLAADHVLKALELGDKWDDPYNRDVVLNEKWSPEFWKAMQKKLAELGQYKGPIDGQLSQATRAAFEKIVDK